MIKLPFISRKKYEAEIAEAKRARIPEPIKGKCENVFTDDQGRQYYRFKDPLEMPAERGIYLARWELIQSMNLTGETLTEYIDEALNANNKSDKSKVGQILHNLKERSSLPPDPDIILMMAAIHYIREDEPWQTFDEKLALEKVEEWKQDKDIRDFFLHLSLKEIYNSGKHSQASIQAYLKSMQEEMERLAPKGKSKTSTNSKTK